MKKYVIFKGSLFKNVCLWMILFGMCLMCISGCGKGSVNSDEKVEQKNGTLQIGISFDSFVIERWLRDRDLFEATAQKLGAEVNVQIANGSSEEQVSQLEYFIRKKVDVIVVIAVDSEMVADVLTKARKEGIRVICYDRLVRNAGTDLYLSFDNEMVGRLMAQTMKEALPDGGNIFAIYGSPTDNNVSMVQKGFLEELEGSNLNIVYSAYCDNWLAELAFDAVEEGLAKNPRNIVGVMCGNDDLAGQAFRVLAENRLAGKVVLVGQDAELAACQRIVEGVQTMTVYKRVEELASSAADFACALGYEKMLEEGRIEKEKIPEKLFLLLEEMDTLEKMNDGTYEIPYYGILPIAVTKDNMDEVIIKEDFHTAEDVYLNVNR